MNMKRPSFSFYSADFLIGVSDLTNEEIGMYIKLLCFQHQKGHLTQRQIGLLLGIEWVNLGFELQSKFKIDENGMIFNARLDKEIGSREQFIEKQRENGKKGGRPKAKNNPQITQEEPNTKPKYEAKNNQKKGIEDEIEIEDEIIIENKEKGVIGEKTEIVEVEVLSETDFENVWVLYGKKGNKKTSSQKWNKLPQKTKQLAIAHIPQYTLSTPEIKYRKNFETYIHQEAWNDEIIFTNGTNQIQNGHSNRKTSPEQLMEAIQSGIERAKYDKTHGEW